MTVKELIGVFDDWNIPVVINDSDLKQLARHPNIAIFVWNKYNVLGCNRSNAEVVAFGLYDGELAIRIS